MSKRIPGHVQENDLELMRRESHPRERTFAISSQRWPEGAADVALHEAALGQPQKAHGAENRCEPRLPADETASMHCVSPLILDRSNVRVLNVSEHGLMIRTAAFLQAGVVVQIRLKNVFVLGEVRYCLPVGEMFHVGVHIQARQPC